MKAVDFLVWAQMPYDTRDTASSLVGLTIAARCPAVLAREIDANGEDALRDVSVLERRGPGVLAIGHGVTVNYTPDPATPPRLRRCRTFRA